MASQRMILACTAGLLAMFALVSLGESNDKKVDKKPEKKKEVWTDPKDQTLPEDFKYQGEYRAEVSGGTTLDCQVIALGNGNFQAVIMHGLPGAGWDGKNKALMDGKIQDLEVVFAPTAGKRKYLAQSPLEFSATTKFPPVGHADNTAILTGGVLTIGKNNGVALQKITRKSPTLGAKPPEGAIVLFDGSNKDEFNGGRLDKTTGYLNTDGGDVTTKRKFSSYTAHVEFMLPFRPDARGQGRGNSGFYQVDQYEVQILDSFGLEGKDNECGGVYTRLSPKVNMCLPPLQWQTYDVEFTNAVTENGKVTQKARITLKHNGVVVHDNAEIVGVTGGARALNKKVDEPEGTPGLLRLQGHGNPLQFRNIWVVEKK